MLAIILHLVLSAAVLLVVAHTVSGFVVASFGSALVGAIILGVVNAIVRPLMIVLTLPLTILTFGLFIFVINALMLKFSAFLVPGMQVSGFGPALIASIFLTILNSIVLAIFPVVGD